MATLSTRVTCYNSLVGLIPKISNLHDTSAPSSLSRKTIVLHEYQTHLHTNPQKHFQDGKPASDKNGKQTHSQIRQY